MSNLQLSVEEITFFLQTVELPSRRKGPLGLMAEEVIRYGSFVGSSVECHKSLLRAMAHGRLHIDTIEKQGESVRSGHVILAETLTASKGRFDRSWHAPEGGLWGCLLHANTLSPSSAILLSLSVGIAACETLKKLGCPDCSVRWVNDVLAADRKIAGFLVESHTSPSKEQFHLVGFGINVNNSEFPGDLEDIATSLTTETKEKIDLKEVALEFLGKLVWNIGLLYYVEARDFHREHFVEHPIIQRFKELTSSIGKRVSFGNNVILQPQFQAKVIDICDDGGLQLQLDDGNIITEHSGEIRYVLNP